MKFSFAKKLYLLVAPTLVVGIVVSTIAWKSLRQGTTELDQALELKTQALLSKLYVAEMSDGLKGYILNPADESQAEKKKHADENNSAAIGRMKSLTQDAKIVKLITQLGEFDDTKLNVAEDKILGLIKAGKHAEAKDSFSKEYLPLRSEYNKISDELTAAATEVSQGEVKQVDSDMKMAANWIILSLALGSLLIIASIAGLASTVGKLLRRTVFELGKVEEEISKSSHAMSTAGNQVSAGASSAAASLQQTVASVEELSSMVRLNADHAKTAAELSIESSQAAETGETEIQALINSMAEIAQSSKKIEEIISVIEDIAFQTNLLALNAAVEAARAGEQGKGFAVVADAVRNLAHRSASAAKDITGLIHESVAKTEGGSKIADRSSVVLKDIVSSIRKISDLNNEISSASSEQSNGIAQISQAMNQLDGATQSNAQAASQVAEASIIVAGQSETLADLVDSLEQLVEGGHTAHKAGPSKETAQKPIAKVIPLGSKKKSEKPSDILPLGEGKSSKIKSIANF